MAEQDQDVMVEIVYYTPERYGERYGVSLREALTNHPHARIVSYQDGSSFVGAEAAAVLKASKADIREEKAEARAAAKAEREEAEPEPMVVVVTPAAGT